MLPIIARKNHRSKMAPKDRTINHNRLIVFCSPPLVLRRYFHVISDKDGDEHRFCFQFGLTHGRCAAGAEWVGTSCRDPAISLGLGFVSNSLSPG